MHAHDRSLLARLGFADPDKKDPRHDLACLYLKEPSTREKIARWLSSRIEAAGFDRPDRSLVGLEVDCRLEHHLLKGQGQYATSVGFLDAVIGVKATIRSQVDRVRESSCNPTPDTLSRASCPRCNSREETTLTRGSCIAGDRVECAGCGRFKRWVPRSTTTQEPVNSIQAVSLAVEDIEHWWFFAEVKIIPTGMGDILRQLNLYTTYCGEAARPRFVRRGAVPTGALLTTWTLTEAEQKALTDAGYGWLRLGSAFEEWSASQGAAAA